MSLSYKIRKAEEEDFSELARIYKSSFKRHNIMGMEETEVINYLLKSNKINSKLGGGYFIAVDSNEKVLGGILLKKKNQDLKGTHYIWKLNHLAVDLEYRGQGIGKKLVNSALNRIEDLIKSEKFKTAKVEIGVSSKDSWLVQFYEKFGFEVEGKLKSHYRFGETMFILGKEIYFD